MSFLSFVAGLVIGCIGMLTTLHIVNRRIRKQREEAKKQLSPYDDINFLNTKMQRCG